MTMFDPVHPVTRAFNISKAQIRARALAGAMNLWSQIVFGPDDATADEWAEAWSPLRQAGPAQIVVLTDAYVTSFLDAFGVTGDNTTLDVDEVLGKVRPGVPDDELVRRPIKQIRYALSKGAPLGDAVEQGRRRLESIEATDMQQAFRVAFRDRVADSPEVRSFRRVLTGSESCALCAVASTQRYRTDQLMPIHPGCDCSVEPVVGPSGKIVDRERLDQLDDLLRDNGLGAGTATGQAELANFKIRLNASSADDVVEVPHGELGPILAVKHHRNVDPGDLPAWVRGSRREFDDTGALVRT